ncbi:MAG TPA: formate--tetrahydrofolate ligase [Firmicutes bacterium]|nr:formate--tetrahydrofolate ligase [Bacillota bacterium]HAW71884.1 formate--tetrahydrofolate ligase [Bacillota bacterium]HAZ21648.1 formate--tetrahydrofolate ligase [Bacillota bacterium]HBG43341.1 formate--tetrahydrofolate ligase [Bacillota bacterium]HBL48668.1 formate--tetrahydrofolate ligase [Bacillota bacterium]
MKSDIQISQEAKMQHIEEIASKVEIDADYLDLYGKYKAKVNLGLADRLRSKPDGKLIFVTAMTPTAAGEGKTTTVVGLTQALGKLGKKVMCCLREPSLGPTFGMKGGAAGGGYSQVVPMEDINLHFTGDIHAVGMANNLLAAMIDNHIAAGNQSDIDERRIVWKRAIDVNDRQLRQIVTGLGGRTNGILTESGFEITAASEVMAVLCLSRSIADLKLRLGRMIAAHNKKGLPVTAGDLNAAGAMAILLKDALKPNLVQTLEGQPAFIHGGPFANIAHGNNSVIATKTALKLSDYVITEGGFASELGAEKFFDIVCPLGNIRPAAAVLVVSVRALKLQGGASRKNLSAVNLDSLERGFANMRKHLDNLKAFGVPAVVAINRFSDDSVQELDAIIAECNRLGVLSAVSEVVAQGGQGGLDLAEKVLTACEKESHFAPLFSGGETISGRLDTLAKRLYGGVGVELLPLAETQLEKIDAMGYGHLPVCVAKTQYSLSDNPALSGAPTGWTLKVRELKVSAGAGFVVALAGNIMTLPGLPKEPAAAQMDINGEGLVSGLS